MSLNFVVLYGSYREHREGIRVAKYLLNILKSMGHKVTFVDAKEKNLPLLDLRYLDYEKGGAPKVLEDIAETFRQADAFIVISGEYNHGIQPGLKNLLDHFYHEYFHRPCGIVSYSISAFGGIRAQINLKTIVSALGMVAIPKSLIVGNVTESVDQKGSSSSGDLEHRSHSFLQELEWYAEAIKAQHLKKDL